MTAIGIRYLMGTAVSSDATRQKAEFPPHPGRVYMALAAAHFETGADAEERAALTWLECLPSAPAIAAPEFSERRPSQGRTLETFVPVNDKHGGIVARSRQARSFPTVRLFSDSMFLVWDAEAPSDVRAALERLCAKVTRIGHSSSLVQMWVADERVEPTLEPSEVDADRRMRVAEPGTLSHLEESFKAGRWPKLAKWQGYRQRTERPAQMVSGPFNPNLIVFEPVREHRILGLESTLQITGALRNAAMSVLPEGQIPEWLSGHAEDGRPSRKPHVAFLPLPFVGLPQRPGQESHRPDRFADGHVMGVAMAIPRDVPDTAARDVIGRLLFDEEGSARKVRLWRQDVWEWNLRRVVADYPAVSLRVSTWTAPSRVWATVTPVVLHHYPKRNRGDDLARILLEAFRSAGFPEPTSIETSSGSQFTGAPTSAGMPAYSEGGAGLCKYQTHVVARFSDSVQGPMLVGRGRFRGYGLFRPLRDADSQEAHYE